MRPNSLVGVTIAALTFGVAAPHVTPIDTSVQQTISGLVRDDQDETHTHQEWDCAPAFVGRASIVVTSTSSETVVSNPFLPIY